MFRRDMKAGNNDAARVRCPPPLVFLAGIIVGYLLHAFVLPFALGLPLTARVALAALPGLGCVILITGALILFRRTGQNPEPWKTTPEIITSGVYRWTRNPMYLALALLQLCVGVGLDNGWIVVLVPLTLVGVYLSAVRPEERYLEHKFGQAYLTYKAKVNRWV